MQKSNAGRKLIPQSFNKFPISLKVVQIVYYKVKPQLNFLVIPLVYDVI